MLAPPPHKHVISGPNHQDKHVSGESWPHVHALPSSRGSLNELPQKHLSQPALSRCLVVARGPCLCQTAPAPKLFSRGGDDGGLAAAAAAAAAVFNRLRWA